MNTTFKTLIAVIAVSLPVAFIAELLGVSLPSVFDTAHAFGAFVGAVTVLTMLNDYRPAKALVTAECPVASRVTVSRSQLPLAA